MNLLKLLIHAPQPIEYDRLSTSKSGSGVPYSLRRTAVRSAIGDEHVYDMQEHMRLVISGRSGA